MITRIFADNFACFSTFQFEPQQVNLLVGDNGSGKSTLVDVVATLRLLATRVDALTSVLLPTSRTRWATKTEQRLELAVREPPLGEFDWSLTVDANGTSGSVEIRAEVIRKDGVVIAERREKTVKVRGTDLAVPYQLDGSMLALRLDDPDLQALRLAVENIMVLKLDLSSIEPTTKKASTSLLFSGANFPSNYRHVRETRFGTVKHFHEALEGVLGGFRSIEFVDVAEDEKALVVTFFADPGRPDYVLAFRELSEGQRALVILTHLLTTFDLKNRTLLIDEPDNYLALRELQPWLQTLSRAVEDQGTQALIVSHNPEVIDYLAAEHAWLFEREDAGPAHVRPLVVDRDSGLKASEQLARGWTTRA